jgi:hypothetical protein
MSWLRAVPFPTVNATNPARIIAPKILHRAIDIGRGAMLGFLSSLFSDFE